MMHTEAALLRLGWTRLPERPGYYWGIVEQVAEERPFVAYYETSTDNGGVFTTKGSTFLETGDGRDFWRGIAEPAEYPIRAPTDSGYYWINRIGVLHVPSVVWFDAAAGKLTTMTQIPIDLSAMWGARWAHVPAPSLPQPMAELAF